MDEHQQHLYRFLMKAADQLRAFQMYEIGQGNGSVTESVNREVLQGLTSIWAAARIMEKPHV
jgi:hypothetical protein